jgi:2'-5' RNA ligase
MLRLFIALPLAEAVRQNLGRLIQRVATTGDGVKWVEPHNLHITLKFLGDQLPEKVPEISAALVAAAAAVPAFELSVGGLGGFPDLHRPRVLWAGVGLGTPQLKALARRVEEAMQAIGMPWEKFEFSAHVTIGRPKSFERGRNARRGGHGPGPAPVAERIRKAFAAREGEAFGSARAGEIHLLQSELTPSGPIYQIVATAPLGG